jgi:uncharacterized protein (UPF0332 family)/predicted nucleotidyltransferase
VLSSKYKAVNIFTRRIRKQMGNRILGVFVYGSVAKGTASKDSDIDVLVVYKGCSEGKILDTASRISFDIVCSHRQLIEVTAMSIEEYRESLGRSPFLWEVLEHGKTIYSVVGDTNWRLEFDEYCELANEYLGYAKDGLKANKIRLAIDMGYNACELLVKALIISKGETLASSHGGIVNQFARLFILDGEVAKATGRELNICLDLRAKARYRPRVVLSIKDAQRVVRLAERLLTIARRRLRK